MGKWTGRAPTWLLWLLFLAIVCFGVVVPSAHLLLAEVLPSAPYGYLRLAIGITFAIWILGRPLLVAVVDRRRPDTPRPRRPACRS